MTRYYIDKAQTQEVLQAISEAQREANCYVNVQVKPYRGKKYNPDTTVVIVVG